MSKVMGLREKGIYRTPQGMRLVASSLRNKCSDVNCSLARQGNGSSFYLYTSYAWAYHRPADYKVSDNGFITLPTAGYVAFRVEDLIDTGYTAGDH